MSAHKWSRLVLATGLLALAMQSCWPGPTPTPRPTATNRPAEPTPTPTLAGVTLTDALGRKVELAQLPRRIVVAGKNILPVLANLFLYPEASDRVVGYAMGSKQSPAAFLGLIYPAFKDIPTFKADAAAEQLVALQPDAVVMKSLSYETLGKSLEALGIPVIVLDLETPEQFRRDQLILGKLLGNPARSAQILAFYDARLTAVADALQGLKPDDKPTVLLLQYSVTGGEAAVSVPPASWLQTLEVELAGGTPVWKDSVRGSGWAVVNLEQVAVWDPQVMLVVNYTADAREAVAKLKADVRWQALQAVKSNRIYGFAGDFFSWDQPDPRWILGVQWIAARLHPDRFPGFDLTRQVAEFFGQMYGMTEAQVQASIVPRLTGDVQ